MKKLIKRLVRYLSAWAWRQEITVSEGIAKLKKLAMDEKGMEMEIEHDPDLAKHIATCFASLVANAPNYTEMQFKTVAKYHGKWDWLTVTIQKLNGKTPHQLRREAEAELELANRWIKEHYNAKKNQWLNSVTTVCADFPNVAAYIAQLEEERDKLLAKPDWLAKPSLPVSPDSRA